MVHQTVGRQLQVLQLPHLRHWPQLTNETSVVIMSSLSSSSSYHDNVIKVTTLYLLNVVIAEPQGGQRGRGVDGGHVGQHVVREAQAAQQGQALQASAV